jgi:hypothetical protein
VPAEAWPYAVTRGSASGYQAIVVPDFIADADQAYVLEYASSQQSADPGVVVVRDVLGATPGPLCLAYRVVEARADRYGLGGPDLLEDNAGRTIRVFEGLALQLPSSRVLSIGLTTADLDAVVPVTVPSFRRLWMAESRVEPQVAPPLPVGGATRGAPPLDLQLAAPYVVPGSRQIRARVSLNRPQERKIPALTGPPDGRPARHGARRSVRNPLITAIAFVCLLAALLAWYLTRPAPASAQGTVQRLCSDLGSGDTGDAYQQYSASYRDATSQDAFAASLLGSGTKASCAVPVMDGDEATVLLRRADGATRTVTLDLQSESGQWRITSMKVSP